MIDTLVLKTNKYIINNASAFVIEKKIIHEGEHIHNRDLFDVYGTIYKGTKAYINMPSYNLYVTLAGRRKKSADGFYDNPTLTIKISIARYKQDNNTSVKSLKQIKYIIQEVITVLNSRGLLIRKETLLIHRIDFFKDISLKYAVKNYFNLIEPININRLNKDIYSPIKKYSVNKKDSLYGSSIYFSNTVMTLILYDKVAEQKNRKVKNLPKAKYLMRMELRIKSTSKFKNLFGYEKYTEFIKPKNYYSAIKFFQDYVNENLMTKLIYLDKQVHIKSLSDKIKLTSKLSGKENDILTYLELVGYNKLLKKHSIDDFLDIAVTKNNMAKSRLKKRLESNKHKIDLIKSKKSKLLYEKDLINELEYKFNKSINSYLKKMKNKK